MTTPAADHIPPPIPQGLHQWDSSASVNTVRAGWDRAEDHDAPGDLLHIYQSTLAGLVDETGGPCPNDTGKDPGPICDCMTAVNHARDFLIRRGWEVFREKLGGDFEEYWLLPPDSPEA